MKYSILIVLLFFSLTLQKSTTPISLNENITFNDTNNLFELNYPRNTSKDSVFFLYYEKTGNLFIEVDSDEEADNYHYDYNQTDEKGYIYFPCIKDNMTYIITLSTEASGNFKIISSEFPIPFDFNDEIKFDYIGFNSKVDYEFAPLILVLENKSDKDLGKIFNHDKEDVFNISMSENNGEDYKEINSEYLYFQKGIKYYIKIEFWEFIIDVNRSYYINPFSIDDFDMNNVTKKEFSLGPIFNEKYKYVYTKINLSIYDYFHFGRFGDIPKMKYALLNDVNEFDSFPINFQYMKFTKIYFDKFKKPENINYMILIINFDVLDSYIYFGKPMPVTLNEERQINETNYFFKLNYAKESKENEMFYIFYELENEKEGNLEIKCEKKSDKEYPLEKKGIINYLLTSTDDYFIFFYLIPPISGKFKVVSTEYEFSIDAKEELYIPKNNFIEYQGVFTFSFINIDKNYIKLFSSNDELGNIISYKKDTEDFVLMKNPLFLMEKGESIKIKVNVTNIKPNFIRISNIDENKVSELNSQTYEFKNPLNQIFKINYLKTPYFEIEGDKSNNYYLSYVTEEQYNKIPEVIEKLSFSKNTNNILHKPEKFYYAVLISEIITNSNLTFKELDKPLNDLVFDSEQSFDSFNSNYKLTFQKADNKEINLLVYKINENGQDFEIKIVNPKNIEKKEPISSKYKNGIYAFEFDEEGDYKLLFNSDKIFEGTFKLVNTSDEFEMNINEDVRYKPLKTKFKPSPIIMVFNIDKENTVIYKKLLVGDNNKQLNLVQIAEDNATEYQNLSLNLFAFEGGKEYKVKIDYSELENNEYKMEQFSMTNYNENLEDFKLGTKKYNNNELNIIFLKIDFSNFTNLNKIEVKSQNDPKFKIAYHKEDVNLTTIINDLTFQPLDSNKYISKNSDNSYTLATLMIELNPGETEIEFKEYKEGDGGKNEKKETEGDNGNLTLILAIAIPVGIILLLIIVFLVCRCYKRKKADIEFKDDGQQKEEILMPETA